MRGKRRADRKKERKTERVAPSARPPARPSGRRSRPTGPFCSATAGSCVPGPPGSAPALEVNGTFQPPRCFIRRTCFHCPQIASPSARQRRLRGADHASLLPVIPAQATPGSLSHTRRSAASVSLGFWMLVRACVCAGLRRGLSADMCAVLLARRQRDSDVALPTTAEVAAHL